MTNITSIRHGELTQTLQRRLAAAKNNVVYVALRADGDAADANIAIVQKGQETLHWRVGHNGGRTRSESWFLQSLIEQALSGYISADGYNVYEQVLNKLKTGWVVLTVRSMQPVTVGYFKSLDELS